jgi:hypothetical protein
MLKLKGRLLFLLAGIATATLFVPGAKAQQPPSNHSILSERGVLLAAYTEKKQRAGRRLRGVWTCYQRPHERCCYNSVTGEEFCTGWPPK